MKQNIKNNREQWKHIGKSLSLNSDGVSALALLPLAVSPRQSGVAGTY